MSMIPRQGLHTSPSHCGRLVVNSVDDLDQALGHVVTGIFSLRAQLRVDAFLNNIVLFCPSSLLLGWRINTWRGISGGASPEVWYLEGQRLRYYGLNSGAEDISRGAREGQVVIKCAMLS